jgi:hypothetical protein
LSASTRKRISRTKLIPENAANIANPLFHRFQLRYAGSVSPPRRKASAALGRSPPAPVRPAEIAWRTAKGIANRTNGGFGIRWNPSGKSTRSCIFRVAGQRGEHSCAQSKLAEELWHRALLRDRTSRSAKRDSF